MRGGNIFRIEFEEGGAIDVRITPSEFSFYWGEYLIRCPHGKYGYDTLCGMTTYEIGRYALSIVKQNLFGYDKDSGTFHPDAPVRWRHSANEDVQSQAIGRAETKRARKAKRNLQVGEGARS